MKFNKGFKILLLLTLSACSQLCSMEEQSNTSNKALQNSVPELRLLAALELICQSESLILGFPIPNELKPFIIETKKLMTIDGLLKAAQEGNAEKVALILAYAAKFGITVDSQNIYGNTALITAAKYGYLPIVELLIAKKASVAADLKNNNGKNALTIAIKKGHIDIVRLLIENGAETIPTYTLIRLASQRGHQDVADLLIAEAFKACRTNNVPKISYHQYPLDSTSWIPVNEVVIEEVGAEEICAQCAKEQAAYKCKKCKLVRYCSSECQEKDWALHEPNCKK